MHADDVPHEFRFTQDTIDRYLLAAAARLDGGDGILYFSKE
jgi:hypothetical protein